MQDKKKVLLNASMLLVKEIGDAPDKFQLDPELAPMILNQQNLFIDIFFGISKSAIELNDLVSTSVLSCQLVEIVVL